MIVDGGRCVHGLESTIVPFATKLWKFATGPITKGDCLNLVSCCRGCSHFDTGFDGQSLPGPPLIISRFDPAHADLSDIESLRWPKRTGMLLWSRSGEEFEFVEYLSHKQDLREAAANRYGALRRLDEAGLDLIVAEAVPETGLGVAIMERLRKAAARE